MDRAVIEIIKTIQENQEWIKGVTITENKIIIEFKPDSTIKINK